MTTFQKQLGAHLKHERMKRGLTLGELASQVGLGKSMLSQVENGVNSLSLESLIRLVRFLKLDLNPIVYKHMPRICPRCHGRGLV